MTTWTDNVVPRPLNNLKVINRILNIELIRSSWSDLEVDAVLDPANFVDKAEPFLFVLGAVVCLIFGEEWIYFISLLQSENIPQILYNALGEKLLPQTLVALIEDLVEAIHEWGSTIVCPYEFHTVRFHCFLSNDTVRIDQQNEGDMSALIV